MTIKRAKQVIAIEAQAIKELQKKINMGLVTIQTFVAQGYRAAVS